MTVKIPDILTYRYDGAMVYVTPAATYEEGVQFAQRVFPELASVDPARIVISVNGIVNQKRQLIRIGAMAWKTVVFSRARFEVLDITLDPEIVVSDTDGERDAPPDYASLKEKDPNGDFLAPSRAPSPRRTQGRLLPDLTSGGLPRSRSRSPSPSATSTSESCSPVEWARSLFGKRVHG
ncbi:hypothetical protein C8Q78DRAFT_985997 [Trametes maxima]|nr:hypothetical protein C8Q78DRAFT_985997 [Trametes maxima]